MDLKQQVYSLKCALASFLSKYVVAVFHPLEVLKTRIQSHDGQLHNNHVPRYTTVIGGIRDIYHSEGIKGLYKGVHLSTFASAFSSSCFFFLYEKQKLQYQSQGIPTMTATCMSGVQGGIFAAVITQPIWVVKTRVMLNTNTNISEVQNMKEKTREIWQQGSAKGFYKGLSLNIMLSAGSILRVFTYEGSKLLFEKLISSSKQFEGVKYFLSGGTSKLVTTLISYPFTTIRTRIQQNQYFGNSNEPKYKNIRDVFRKILTKEGVTGFYKGLIPSLIRVVPNRSVYFYSYELLKSIFIDSNYVEQKRKKEQNNRNDY